MPTGVRILFIDDDPKVRTISRLMLERAGYEVQEAENGAAGLGFYREHSSALVMTDILMPVMEGFETVIALRRLDPKVKIIAMTAAHEQIGAYLNTAEKLGAVGILKKPFTQTELLLAVSEALGERRRS
jgi:CheY-like chemotaxis protein